MRNFISIFTILICVPFVVSASELSDAIENTRKKCSFIAADMDFYKKGTESSVVASGIGTVAGGVALGSGLTKDNIDKKINENKSGLEESETEPYNTQPEIVDVTEQETDVTNNTEDAEVFDIDKMNKKYKTLGYVQSGALATSAFANAITLASSSGIARDTYDVISDFDKCIAATKELSNIKMMAHVSGTANEAELAQADKIISACSQWESFDFSKLKKRATGTAISSGVAAGSGAIGAGTALGAADAHKDLENDDKLLNVMNKVPNIASGVTTAASGIAAGFSAAQLKIIKRGVEIAEECMTAFE